MLNDDSIRREYERLTASLEDERRERGSDTTAVLGEIPPTHHALSGQSAIEHRDSAEPGTGSPRGRASAVLEVEAAPSRRRHRGRSVDQRRESHGVEPTEQRAGSLDAQRAGSDPFRLGFDYATAMKPGSGNEPELPDSGNESPAEETEDEKRTRLNRLGERERRARRKRQAMAFSNYVLPGLPNQFVSPCA